MSSLFLTQILTYYLFYMFAKAAVEMHTGNRHVGEGESGTRFGEQQHGNIYITPKFSGVRSSRLPSIHHAKPNPSSVPPYTLGGLTHQSVGASCVPGLHQEALLCSSPPENPGDLPSLQRVTLCYWCSGFPTLQWQSSSPLVAL